MTGAGVLTQPHTRRAAAGNARVLRFISPRGENVGLGVSHRFASSAPRGGSAKFSGNSAPAPANAFLTKSTVSLCGFDFSLSRSLMALTLTAAAVARSSCDQQIDL